jgi:hypothetical protein
MNLVFLGHNLCPAPARRASESRRRRRAALDGLAQSRENAAMGIPGQFMLVRSFTPLS